MGFTVVGLGLAGVSIVYYLLTFNVAPGLRGAYESLQILAGFGFGASSIALFARVAGGIYTKAADVGADLVGKVEAGIDEDDPHNPAVIADNVGDNAGMGADLFESYVGSIIAAMTLGAAAASSPYNDDYCFADAKTALPLWLASVGIFCAIIGCFAV